MLGDGIGCVGGVTTNGMWWVGAWERIRSSKASTERIDCLELVPQASCVMYVGCGMIYGSFKQLRYILLRGVEVGGRLSEGLCCFMMLSISMWHVWVFLVLDILRLIVLRMMSLIK